MTILDRLLERALIRPLDHAFAEFIAENESKHPQLMSMIAATLSMRLGQQDTCVFIEDIGQPFLPDFCFPDSQVLHQELREASTAVETVTDTEPAVAPFILEDGRLYLQRYWQYEKRLAIRIRHMCGNQQTFPEQIVRGLLKTLFPVKEGSQINWQKIAVCVALRQQLTLITGGPGTGKTTTVTKLLAVLQGVAHEQNQSLKIELVAPTGKAAARLNESIANAKAKLPAKLQHGLPSQCSTIHRLLGSVPNSPYFTFNQQNPLHLDLLVVDEASMVDLPLMEKLFSALPDRARVVMLGDKDQLASVEAGSVLSDICAAALGGEDRLAYSTSLRCQLRELCGFDIPAVKSLKQSVLDDNLVVLRQSHRFAEDSGIGQLANAINRGRFSQCMRLFEDNAYADVERREQTAYSDLLSRLIPNYLVYFSAIQTGKLKEAFDALQRQQVLCAQRLGKWGVIELNQLIERELSKQGVIDTSREYYSGRPIMLSQNDHRQKLFNGDIGIVMPDPVNPEVTKVWFIDDKGQYRGILTSRLPPNDTLYAMTIHKSQGSEFDNVIMCLPIAKGSQSMPGLNRELLYTGLTRARIKFCLYSDKNLLRTSLDTLCQRSSGLANRLEK